MKIGFMIAGILMHYQCYTMNNTFKFQNRAILTFLDDDEKDIGAISGDLLTALSQEAGPILASTALLKNIFAEYNGDLKNSNNTDLLIKYQMALRSNAEDDVKFILVKASNFDPKKWVAKAVINGLTLLIPTKLLNTLLITHDDVKKNDASQDTTTTELSLGLRVNHLVTIDNVIEYSQNYTGSFTNASYFVDALSKKLIFCSKAIYPTMKPSQVISWAIFIQGHGTHLDTIVGMKIQDFKKIHNYIQNDIYCHLLVYSSCYGAGQNLESLYKDNTSIIQTTLSFPIITQAITDAPTLATQPTVKLRNNNELYLDPGNLNFVKFISIVTNLNGIDYLSAAKSLSAKQDLFGDYWANAPQIKLPGTEWFSILESPKKIVSIGSILSHARDPEKPLDLAKFFKTEPEVILLYASKISFELIINSKNLDAFISMIPGDATHIIERISSTNTGNTRSENIINSFMVIEGLASTKIFYIKKLNELDDVIIYNYKPKIITRMQRTSPSITYACYRVNGKTFIQQRQFVKRDLADKDPEKQKYLSMLNTLQGKVSTIELIDFSKTTIANYDVKIPDITTSHIINNINAQNYSFSVIYYGFSDKMKDGTVVWINNINVKFSEEYLKIPGIKVNDRENPPVLNLQNLIFDNTDQKNFKYFFTYNGAFYDKKGEIKDDYKEEYKTKITTSSLKEEKHHNTQLPTLFGSQEREQFKKDIEKGFKKRYIESEKKSKTYPTSDESTTKQKLSNEKDRAKMSSFELENEVDKLTDQEKGLCKNLLTSMPKSSDTSSSSVKKFIDAITAMKSKNLMNAILPIVYNTPLNEAIMLGVDYNNIKLLIDNGANVNGIEGDTPPLEKAVKQGSPLSIVQLLLDRGAKIDNSDELLYWTINSQDRLRSDADTLEIVKILIKNGANVNAEPFKNTNLLISAISNQLFDVAIELIKNGANVNKKDQWGDSALKSAATFDKRSIGVRLIDTKKALELIALLIEKDAEITEEIIAKTSNPEVKKYLQDHIASHL